MKKIFITLTISFNVVASCFAHLSSATKPYPVAKEPHTIRVMSYNIRGENATDRVRGHSWDNRKLMIKQLIDYYQPDIIGMQEISTHYPNDLRALFPAYTLISQQIACTQLDPDYQDVGILFNKNRFTLIKHSFFWLSDDPFGPRKKSWESRQNHIVHQLHLKDNQTGKEFNLWVTHLPSDNATTRLQCAQLIDKLQEAVSGALLVMGDFNMFGNTKGQVYQTLTSHLNDVKSLSKEPHYGPHGTWIGWEYDTSTVLPNGVGERLDHMFVKNIEVMREGTLRDKIKNGAIEFQGLNKEGNFDSATPYPSDHLPIVADIKIAA